jgi:hypothetical protein
MDVESLAKQLILQNMTPEQQNAVLESVRASLLEARSNQKRRVSENVGMVVDALKKIEADIRAKYDDLGQKITDRVNSVRDGVDGIDGRDGKDGKDGRPGRDGATGPMGPAGKDGRDGVDGEDGVSVIDAKIDFDGSLVITLSNGREINVGEVVAADVAEKIRVLTYGGNSGGGGGTSGLTYKGTWNASTNTPTLITSSGTNGDYYIVSVAGTTDLNGITDWSVGDWAIFNGTAWQKIDQSWATAGANNNITSMTGITGGISSPDFIQFDTGATVTNAAGRLYWDATQQTLTVGLNANIAADVGQTLYAYATNDEAVTINKGQPVYMFAAQGDRVSVKLAYNTGDATSAKTLGICAENIAAGQAGMILCQGVQDGLDLSAYTAGDTLYLGATAGTLTNVKPYAPNHLVYIGVVERANMGSGRLYVRVQNGYEMDELHNVSAQNPTNGQVLIYNESTSLWTKNTLTDGTGITITEGAGSITVTNAGVTSLTGTTNEIDVSASTGSVTLSLPATINADTTGNAATVTNGAYVNVANTFSTNQIISDNSTTAALRITQTGTGNALVVEDSTNPDSTPFVVDASGKLMLGTTTAETTAVGSASVQILGGTSPLALIRKADSSTPINIEFAKARASGAVLASGDTIGRLYFSGSDGSTQIPAAYIDSAVDGTPGTNDMPGRLVFSTTADGASSPTERMRIDSSGNVGIGDGTISPSQELVVYKDQNSTTRVSIDNANAGTTASASLELSADTGAAIFVCNSSGSTAAAITGGALSAGLYTSNALTNGLSVGTSTGPLKFFAGSTTVERMRISSTGAIDMAATSSLQKNSTNAYALKNIVYLTSGTAATYTTPTGVRALKVTVIGGGGGGGGVDGQATASTNAYSGGGGGAGYATAFIATAEASYTYTVGSGGTGGAAGNNAGAAGGTTEFKNAGSTVIISATGGGGGAGDLGTTSTSSVAGTPGIGSITGLGSPGGVIGEGTSPMSTGYGRTINGTVYNVNSSGYCPIIGGGVDNVAQATGANAAIYGEGGGNVRTTTASANNYAGGNGFAGLIIVEEYY